MKLSKPQMRLLRDVCHADGPRHCVSYFKPAQALVKKGLAKFVKPDKLAPTAAGRELIQDDEKDSPPLKHSPAFQMYHPPGMDEPLREATFKLFWGMDLISSLAAIMARLQRMR